MNALGDWLEAIVVGVVALIVGIVILGRVDAPEPSPVRNGTNSVLARGHVPTATPRRAPDAASGPTTRP